MIRDPVRFGRGVFTDRLWSRQEDILEAIGTPHASVAVKGCHASAKTHAAARAALWFVTRYPDGIVVTTAPKDDQLELLLWKEIRAAMAQARIQYPDPLTTALKLSERNYMVGLVAKDATRFQGFHAPHLLFVIDEAPGVPGHIWEAIEGARAGGDVRVLALGNPTILSGPFYDAFTKGRTRWTTISISAFDTPNLADLPLEELRTITALDDPRFAYAPAPYLATRRWVWEKWEEWGRHGHPLWDARVLGQFPAQAENALIALSWLEQAQGRAAVDAGGECRAGIDVAGPGEDETVLVVREGSAIVLQRWWPSPDPRGELLAALAPYKARLKQVNVDTVGIGYYLGKHLEDAGFKVVHVNVGAAPRDPERYRNLKAELYWGLRLRFQEGGVAGALSEEAMTQLCGIRYSLNARGQIEIESKDDARKRGVKSPDRAEAIMLAFGEPPVDGYFAFLEEQAADVGARTANRPTIAAVREVAAPVDVDREARLRAVDALERQARGGRR
jgi:phage terminase large subunit